MAAANEARLKLLAIDCIRAMKGQRTFRALSRELELPVGVLSRYLAGNVLPKTERAESIISYFLKSYLAKYLEQAKSPGGLIVTADILSQPFLLNALAYKAKKMFPVKIDCVFTAAVDGIPLAIAVANQFGATAIYAKRTQEIAFSGHYVSKSNSRKALSVPFFVPKSLIKKNDAVLIVDDVIRAGTTFEALTSICQEAKADVVGIFAIFITKEAKLAIKQKVGYLAMAEK